MSTTTMTPAAFLPDEFGSLLVTTASKMSIAMQTTTVVNTRSTEFRIPIISSEIGASWYGEKDEITITDPGLAEEVVRPRKVAGLSKISNELANDSNPASAQVIGDSLGRTIATNIDAALYGNADGAGNPPKGLGAFTNAQVTLVAAPAAWANVDPFTEAVYKLDAIGATLAAFIANPADAEALAKLKRETGSNEPLLAPDANSATRHSLAGVPLYTSPAVPVGTIYGYDPSRVFTVLREGASVEVDRSVFFTSDSVGVRGTARVAFGYPHPKSIARITLTK